jgi:hypothetical protein
MSKNWNTCKVSLVNMTNGTEIAYLIGMMKIQRFDGQNVSGSSPILEVRTMIPVRQRVYTGICDAHAPASVCRLLHELGAALGKSRFTLRSGGNGPGELALERGATSVHANRQIYLPWPGFNHHSSPLHQIPDGAFKISSSLEPNWVLLGRNSRKLKARVTLELFGKKLDRPSLFLLCWTPSGKGQGDCADAIALAQHADIPVIDLGKYDLHDPTAALTAVIDALHSIDIEAQLSSSSGQMLLAV